MQLKKTIEGCKDCTMCCEYIIIEINKPKTRLDLEEIKWFLLHDVTLLIDGDDTWNIVVKNKCSALDKKGKCSIYISRPLVCREYSHEECEKYKMSKYLKPKKRITNLNEFMKYINKDPALIEINNEDLD